MNAIPATVDDKPTRSVTLAGVRLHAITERECIEHIVAAGRAGRGGVVVTPNLDHLRRLEKSPDLRELYARADLCVADGMPLLWASRLRGTPLPERVAGSSLTISLTEAAAAAGLTVFFLGGDPGTADAAARILGTRFPALQVAGTACPSHGFERDPEALHALENRLRDTAPRIVYVALGSPKQEHVIEKLRGCLPQAWWIGVGISFSFVTGDVRRAPRWMQRCGLEWLHRLVQEPRRLVRRYLIEGVPYAGRLFVRSWRERFRSTAAAERDESQAPGSARRGRP